MWVYVDEVQDTYIWHYLFDARWTHNGYASRNNNCWNNGAWVAYNPWRNTPAPGQRTISVGAGVKNFMTHEGTLAPGMVASTGTTSIGASKASGRHEAGRWRHLYASFVTTRGSNVCDLNFFAHFRSREDMQVRVLGIEIWGSELTVDVLKTRSRAARSRTSASACRWLPTMVMMRPSAVYAHPSTRSCRSATRISIMRTLPTRRCSR